MKHLRRFISFELFKESVDWNSQEFIDDIEDRLVDFKHLGFDVVVSQSSSYILDFDKKRRKSEPGGSSNRYLKQLQVILPPSSHVVANMFHIKSSEIDSYNSGISRIGLTIGLSPRDGSHVLNRLGSASINIDELSALYDDFSFYLRKGFGLIPNYINITRIEFLSTTGGGYAGQFLYFKDFESIKEFLKAHNAVDTDNIQIGGLNLGFYK